MKKFLRNNGLSLVFFLLFLFAMVGQILTGMAEHNKEMIEEGGKAVGLGEYLTSGHFLQATFENWESEFLQMAMFVILSIFLYQKGSSESKDPEGEEPVDAEPDSNKADAPWMVRHGGWMKGLYKNSLSIVLVLLFVGSFLLHFTGSLKDHNEEQALKGEPAESASAYMGSSRFWFESFQNWESEFLSVLTVVLLSVSLRQKGSPQSKPVDTPNSETGE